MEDPVITSEKQKKKMEKELKSKQKEIAKQEKKEKEREERENKAKAKEEKKKEKLEKKSAAARSNMKANSVQGQPSMEDFRWATATKTGSNPTKYCIVFILYLYCIVFTERVTMTPSRCSCLAASTSSKPRVWSRRGSTGSRATGI